MIIEYNKKNNNNVCVDRVDRADLKMKLNKEK